MNPYTVPPNGAYFHRRLPVVLNAYRFPTPPSTYTVPPASTGPAVTPPTS
jgi:hypothetical protein